jgi:hypothetical protein
MFDSVAQQALVKFVDLIPRDRGGDEQGLYRFIKACDMQYNGVTTSILHG